MIGDDLIYNINMSNGSIVLEGSHGTSKTAFEGIKIHGFQIPRSGRMRLGSGVYFWKKCDFWRELAIAWIRQRRDEYNSNEKNGIIIFCSFPVEEIKILSIGKELRVSIYKFAKASSCNMNNKNEIAKIFDWYINKLEKENGIKYYIIEGEVNPPNTRYFNGIIRYPSPILGQPITLAIRELSCIQHKHEEEISL